MSVEYPCPEQQGKGAVRIGPFVVIDELGSGGMGRVFRARYVPQDKSDALPLDT